MATKTTATRNLDAAVATSEVRVAAAFHGAVTKLRRTTSAARIEEARRMRAPGSVIAAEAWKVFEEDLLKAYAAGGPLERNMRTAHEGAARELPKGAAKPSGSVAQRLEQGPHKPFAVGSNPTGSTISEAFEAHFRARLDRHHLDRIDRLEALVEFLEAKPAPRGLAIDSAALDAATRAYLDRSGAKLVRDVTDDMRANISRIIGAANASGTRARAAREILDLKGFGLSVRGPLGSRNYQSWVERLYLRPGNVKKNGELNQRGQRAARARYNVLLKKRSKLIAISESYDAGNAARRNLWTASAAAGELDADRYELIWHTRLIKACARCRALNGVRGSIVGGVFVSNVVTDGSFKGGTVTRPRPTVHPNCHCTLAVVLRKVAVAPVAEVPNGPQPLTGAELRGRIGTIRDDIRTRLADERDVVNREYRLAVDAGATGAELRAISRKISAIDKRVLTLTKQARAGAIEALVENRTRGDIPYTLPKGGRIKERKAIEEFLRRIAPSVPKGPVPVVKIRGRSYFSLKNETVHLGSDNPAVLAHELGHYIEAQRPDIADKVRAFLARRVGKEKTTIISAGEWGFKDEFLNHYIGRVYARTIARKSFTANTVATEVLSMGLQYLWGDPAWFAKNDPDMFDFIISLLRN